MDKHKCAICGYIYDPDIGDIDGAVDEGTYFFELPESWECPMCGADSSMFDPIK